MASNLLRTLTVFFVIALSAPSAHAEEVTSFMGKVPTEEDLVKALTPLDKSEVRMRGVRIDFTGEKSSPKVISSASKPVPKKQPRIALDIKFDFDSDQLTQNAKNTLLTLSKALKSEKFAGSTFVLEGHTDSSGAAKYNLALSKRRALAAKKYLQTVGNLDSVKLVARGYGESRLLVKNDPKSSDNRRVEVVNAVE